MTLITLVLISALVAACPPVIRDTQSVSNIEGWDVRVAGGEIGLEYMEVYIGRPSRRASLRPIEEAENFV